MSNSGGFHRITNAVKTSGTLKEKLFTAAFNSKKQAIVNGLCVNNLAFIFVNIFHMNLLVGSSITII